MYPDNWGCKLNIITKDNKIFEREIINAIGDSRNSLKRNELIGKFVNLSKGILSKEKQEIIINIINKIEQLESIKELVKYL
ncbi:hypothetical protein ES708_21572 [subsurface metagenome]